MKKILVLVLTLVFLSPLWAHAESVGMFKTHFGPVTLIRGDQRLDVAPGTLIHERDIIETQAQGRAGVIFTDGTVITLGPGTRFRIDAYLFDTQAQNYDFSFFMEQGQAVYASGKISKISPESVKIHTPKATVGIRGTRFIIDVD
ncbi:MAG: FecR family protein [Desulfobacterales bacterium]|nr:FecR family protein [Desulfobacterales bacterium]